MRQSVTAPGRQQAAIWPTDVRLSNGPQTQAAAGGSDRAVDHDVERRRVPLRVAHLQRVNRWWMHRWSRQAREEFPITIGFWSQHAHTRGGRHVHLGVRHRVRRSVRSVHQR